MELKSKTWQLIDAQNWSSKLYLSGIEIRYIVNALANGETSKLYLSGIEIKGSFVTGSNSCSSKLYLSGIEIRDCRAVLRVRDGLQIVP